MNRNVRRLHLLVEGQTEEAFVRELLQAHYARMGLYIQPIIVKTSAGHKGGVVRYAQVQPQIERLCKQDSAAYVSTLFDLYALPNDFPGKRDPAYPTGGSGQQKALFLEAALAQDIKQHNFIPNLLVHEYEALLLTHPEAFQAWTNDAAVWHTLRVARQKTAPEDINDGPQTAPSKRILTVMPSYQKTLHGPLIACDIGLDAIRAECPHFDAWLKKLEALN